MSFFKLNMMETTGDAKDIAKFRPLTIAIPSKQGVVLMNRDFSSDATHSRSETPLCPAYRFCRESRRPYRSPVLDSDHDQQITTLHDILQAIKEAALRLIQLLTTDIEERRRGRSSKDADLRIRYPDFGQHKRSDQSRSLESGLIAATSSSVCALCGVGLHPKKSSKETKQFVVDRERNDDRDVALKHLENIFMKMAYKVPSPVEKDKNSDVLIPGSVLDYILPKEIDISAKGQEKISSKTQSTATSERGLKSKLLLVRRTLSDKTTCQICQDKSQRMGDSANQLSYVTSTREYNVSESSHQCIVTISPTISSTQDASTLTQEMLCPCACGLLVRDGIESEVSIKSSPISQDDKFIKTKLEELGLHLDSREMAYIMARHVPDDIRKIKKTKMQKLKKDINVKRWIEEVVQLRLQVQIEELHKNIRFFKRENEYIRRLAEKCRCLSEDIKGLQQLLPIRDTHSGLTTTIRHLQAQYHNEHGIIATLTGMFRGSINIQQIVVKLLASLTEHWNPRDSMATTRASSTPRAQAPLKPPSSILNVY